MTTPLVSAATFDPDSCPAAALSRCWISIRTGEYEDVRLPLLIARGRRPGPTALFVAGVHGDEFEGPAAIGRLMKSLDPDALCGTVLALPICNPFAFQAQSRTTPASIDGANLAREFPGKSSGMPTQRLAAALFGFTTRLLGGEDLFVDLHSAGTKYRYGTLIGFRDMEGSARATSEEAARHFSTAGHARIWSIWPSRGMFNSETSAAGIPTVATEAPGQGLCRETDVRLFSDGLRNLLRYKGIVPGDPPQRNAVAARKPTELLAESDGLLITMVEAYDRVEEGQLLGRIVDPFGATLSELRAPHHGEVWAVRTFGTISAGEYAAWIAA